MRGKVLDRMTKVECKGITPAYAGKSLSFFSFLSFFKDHPRLCGEKYLAGAVYIANIRITPAYAGKRPMHTEKDIPWQDHPRLCGEKEFPRNFNNCITGSPPPMRGKARTEQAVSVQRRITPAYAGKRQLSTP